VAKANNNENLNTDLATIFSAIESSANGYPSEVDIKGLFAIAIVDAFITAFNVAGEVFTDKAIKQRT
jgi:type I restriction enzyme M protein